MLDASYFHTGPAAHLDFETRSACDLKKAGVYRYAEDPTTRPWGFSYRIGDMGVIKQWRPGYPDPTDLLDHIRAGGRFGCHNAAFERTIWNWVVVYRMCPHWPTISIAQQDCTMSRAAAIAHPQALDGLGKALGLNFQKDMEGHRLMMKMAKPRRFEPDGSIVWWDDAADIDRNMRYCDRDVEVETEAHLSIPPLTDAERRVWEFDQLINERGVAIDVAAATAAADLVVFAKKQNDKVMREITDRNVPKCSNDAKLIAWLNSRGVECTSLAKGEIEDVVFLAETANDQQAHDAIRLRQAAWKTSTAKYKAMGECVNSDGRVRGLLNYHGAGTGRWAGRLLQPQNLKRVDPDDECLIMRIAYLHEVLRDYNTRDAYDMIADIYGPLEVMDLLSSAIRSMFKSGDGMKFIGGDFSNIEGRVNAWLAGETWKLQAFQDYDDGVGPDLYKLAYARSFGVEVDSVGKGPKRQMGKVQELALGYQGGVGAFISMGATYGLSPYSLSGPVKEATDVYQWDATVSKYHAPGIRKYDLKAPEWAALQILVDNWRGANSAIVQSWWNYQDAAIEAVGAPGTIVYPAHTQRVYYYSDGRCLWCVLPSGRALCYASPELVEEFVEFYDVKSGEMKQRLKRKVTYWGIDSRTRQWTKQSLYGGLQCENIVQAVARDVMVDAMFKVEEAGYPVILTVHDEILSEVPEWDTTKNETEFAAVMATTSEVYAGLPVSVGAWEDTRYVK